MGCNSPFHAVTGHAVVDPTRHVNFTNGMVLGAEDYAQEFGYLSARDQWICREALGYGTLCGLAVEVRADGDHGPRIAVSAGSAVAPSGQLIRVGREQCGSLNSWLNDPEIAARVDALADGIPAPKAFDLTLYLTLSYTDCAVAPVPIPGEPCRGAEELMQPSRIADDYILSFAFTPPPMEEVDALVLLDGYLASIKNDAATDMDARALDKLASRALLQLRLALGAGDSIANPADLEPIVVHPDLRPALLLAIRRLWVTRLRPLVAARANDTGGEARGDGLLLAVLTVPVIHGGGGWAVKAGATPPVMIDESRRPVLLAGNAAASAAAAAFSAASAATSSRALAFMTTSGTSPLSQGLVLIRAETDIDVRLGAPKSTLAAQLLELRNLGPGVARLVVSRSNRIGGKAGYALTPGARVTLRPEGPRQWRVLDKSEGRS